MPPTPQSPPKRMTRARAKAAEAADTGPKVTRIITASAKAVPRAPKRKAQQDEDETETCALEITTASAKQSTDKVKSTRGRPRKVPPPTVEEIRGADNVRVQGLDGAKRGRGRPKKMTVASDIQVDTAVDDGTSSANEPEAQTATADMQPVGKRAQTARKRVTFQEPTDEKENDDPMATLSSKAKVKPAVKLTGLRAAPVRRPGPKQSQGRGQKESKNGKDHGEAELLPLSPKKDRQVAKVDPITSEDDELSGPKTPMKTQSTMPKTVFSTLRKSPVKFSTSSLRSTAENVNRENSASATGGQAATPTVTATSPTKNYLSAVLGSPPKRPPPSPFKDSLRRSPVRPPAFCQRSVPGSASLTRTSQLQVSPKKLILPRQGASSALHASSTDCKGSTIQSPARRPPSPIKSLAPVSPRKVPATTAIVNRKTVSPGKEFRSPMKAVRSSEQCTKVHVMTPKEQREILEHGMGKVPSSDLDEGMKEQSTEEAESPVPASTAEKSLGAAVTSASTQLRQDCASLHGPEFADVEFADCKDETESVHVENVSQSRQIQRTQLSTTHLGAQQWLHLRTPVARGHFEDDSEDELQSPNNQASTPWTDFARGDTSARTVGGQDAISDLAQRFQNLKGPTPDAWTVKQRIAGSAKLFSPVPKPEFTQINARSSFDCAEMSALPTFFEDAMATRGAEDMIIDDNGIFDRVSSFSASQLSEASQQYGDENEIPIDPALLELSLAPSHATVVCTPAKLASLATRTIHTTSKVPLKPAAEDSPSRKPAKKRSRSASGILSPRTTYEVQEWVNTPLPLQWTPTSEDDTGVASRFVELFTPSQGDPVKSGTPNRDVWSTAGSPARTPRADLDGKLLKGAIVYVDVHTTEGADASGIFVELLTQMGAKCVKQWSWNPRASTGGEAPVAGDELEPASSSKIGITHVVFKDGGKRTMEKVREAKGVVACVGVGWVLDCERENRWVDESAYAIDTVTVPRGGHRRRKSMEPRILSNLGGNMTPPAATVEPVMDKSPTKEFLTFSSPSNRRESFVLATADLRVSFAPLPDPAIADEPGTPSATCERADEPGASPITCDRAEVQTPVTAYYTTNIYRTPEDDSLSGSPATPYFLKVEALVQKTCPPKQPQPLLFPLSGRINDQPDEGIRQRLLLARRKSLQWAPKVGSPLARGYSYGL